MRETAAEHEPTPERSLRLVRASEAEALATLVNDAYGRTEADAGWTSEDDILAGPRIRPAGVEAILADEDSRLLASETDDGALAGCLHLQPLDEGEAEEDDAETERVELGLLSVRPELQDEGLGRALLAAGEAHAGEEMGADEIVLTVLTVREELLAWYERRGYERTGETKRFEPQPPQRSLVGELAFEVLVKSVA